MRSKISRIIFSALLCISWATLPIGAAEQSTVLSADQNNRPLHFAKVARYHGEVIFVRGGFGVFSKGLDAMSTTLAKRGVKSRVVRNAEAAKTYMEIVRNRKRYGSKPVIIVGHSWGADAAIQIARLLTKNNIRVNFLVTFAATAPQPIPSNVRKATNYYFKTNGWGRPVRRGKGMRGNLKNVDLSNKQGIHHFNVEKKPHLQNQVVNNILRILGQGKRA